MDIKKEINVLSDCLDKFAKFDKEARTSLKESLEKSFIDKNAVGETFSKFLSYEKQYEINNKVLKRVSQILKDSLNTTDNTNGKEN